ncbi:hypothetical protein Pcinc_002394 [Petrolisthes cinctipes]|uniref:inositol-pentakisphosphate 2-kinase n=1 Tax=Petrolisthes cinctipes TaxID=88211 RepID=A0AAE1L2A7_PETCI|nr:hypothetical protein Pcinc_002394 [Petrolisthes cinctipes]
MLVWANVLRVPAETPPFTLAEMLMAAIPLPPTTPLCSPPLAASPHHLYIDMTAWQQQQQQQQQQRSPPQPTQGSAEGRLVSILSPDLTYRGEGADHIVLRLAASGQVLRLRKTPVGVVTRAEELILRAVRDETFLLKVARPILGPLMTDESHLVEVDPRVRATLRDTVEPWRQDHRQDKEINKHGIACVCPDAATIFINRRDTSSPSPPQCNMSSSLPSSPSTSPLVLHPTHSSPLYSTSSPSPSPLYPTLSPPLYQSEHKDVISLVVTAAEVESPTTDLIWNLNESLPTNCLPNINCDLVSSNSAALEYVDEDTRTVPEVNRNRDVDGIGRTLSPKKPRNVCVEIKPKQGFLDLSTPNLPLCRYCVKQFLKRSKEGLTRSSYCPLDLFSGDIGKMRQAIDSLMKSPQNNFRIFEDGEPKENCQPYRYIRDVIIAALTFDFTSGHAKITRSDQLSPRSALGRILAFQNLDRLGVFKATRLYQKLVRKAGSLQAADTLLHDLRSWPASALPHLPLSLNLNEHHSNKTTDWKLKKVEQGDTSVHNKQLHGSRVNQVEEQKQCDGIREEEEEEMNIEEMVRELQRYLVSTTAKDLSLMILVSGPFTSDVPATEPNTSPFIIEVKEEEEEVGSSVWYKCQVTGVDLVAKPSSKIPKHERDYEKLRQALVDLRGSGEEPRCWQKEI